MEAYLREGVTCHSIIKCSPAARAIVVVPYLAIYNNLGTEYSCTLRSRVNSNTWDTFEKYIFRRVISTCKECRLTLDFIKYFWKIQIVLDSYILLFFFSTIDCFSLGRKDLRRDEKWNGRRHNKKVFRDTNNTEGEFDKTINHIHTWCRKLSLNGNIEAKYVSP